MLRSFCIVILLGFLSACGFHLRGFSSWPTSINSVAIIAPENSRILENLLKEQLQSYNVQTIEDPTLAKYWLVIKDDKTEKQIAGVSSSTTPRQYQLIYTVCFYLKRASGEIIVPLSQVVTTRQWTANSDRILGSNAEEHLLKTEMQQDAVRQIFNRVHRFASQHQ